MDQENENQELDRPDNGKLPAAAREALERNNLFLDVTGLAEDHPFIRDMTEIEIGCAFGLFQTGCPEAASQLLGINRQLGATASRRASVQRLLRVLVRADVQSTGVKKAYDALTSVLDDSGESANARIKAAETVLKWSGELGGESDKEREAELSNMSIHDLERTIHKLQDQRDKLSKDAPARPV
jgi:hypothetical protein